MRPDSPPPWIPRWGKGSRREGRKPRIMAQMGVRGNGTPRANLNLGHSPVPTKVGCYQNNQAPAGPQALSASVVKLSPQPHSAVAFGLLNVKVSLSPCLPKSITVPSTRARLLAST